jgi:hypothetical protein
MKSPMQDILARQTAHARAAKEAAQITAIIEEEESACAARIDARIRPILVKEFRRVAKRYGVKEVIFGNGTCLIVRVAATHLGSNSEELPKGLHRLAYLCDAVASSYPTEDLR